MGNSHNEVKAENQNEEMFSPNPEDAIFNPQILQNINNFVNLQNFNSYDLNFQVKPEKNPKMLTWSTDPTPINLQNKFQYNQFGYKESFEVSILANILITTNLQEQGIITKFVSTDKLILGELKLKLIKIFDPTHKGNLEKCKFQDIMQIINSDHIFFEKLEMELNEQLFHKNHQFHNITGVQERFIGDLRHAGIEFTDPDAKEECLIQQLRENQRVQDYTVSSSDRDLIVKSQQMPLAFGFKKQNNGHYWGSFKDGKREGYGVYQFYEEKQSHFGYWLESKLLKNIILKFHSEEGNISELWVGNLNSAVQLDGYSSLTIYNNDGSCKWSKQGRITEGKIDGFGVYQQSNGDHLKGFMKKDKREGFSQYFWTSGSNQIGQWRSGFREGYGEQQQDSKDVQKGFWRQGMFEGWGFYEWAAKNDCYEGQWKGHVREGYGRYRYEDVRIEEGIFVGNQLEDRQIDPAMDYKFKFINRKWGN